MRKSLKAARSRRASVVSSSRSEAADLVSAVVVAVLGQVEDHDLVTYSVDQGPWCCILSLEEVG